MPPKYESAHWLDPDKHTLRVLIDGADHVLKPWSPEMKDIVDSSVPIADYVAPPEG